MMWTFTINRGSTSLFSHNYSFTLFPRWARPVCLASTIKRPAPLKGLVYVAESVQHTTAMIGRAPSNQFNQFQVLCRPRNWFANSVCVGPKWKQELLGWVHPRTQFADRVGGNNARAWLAALSSDETLDRYQLNYISSWHCKKGTSPFSFCSKDKTIEIHQPGIYLPFQLHGEKI